ncbi:hypothetical protein ACT80S_08620 [Ramlibacter sp. MAHUQ-53]|uniref:hypothetical protein n=1 Tax=unclassified Ramlibacter TaxID=2617605 RepID=UPI003632D472
MIRTLALIASLLALAGCSEKPQTLGGVKSDVPAFQGTGSNFTAPGWKPGDKTSWEQQLKTRGQGQNDYAKAQ